MYTMDGIPPHNIYDEKILEEVLRISYNANKIYMKHLYGLETRVFDDISPLERDFYKTGMVTAYEGYHDGDENHNSWRQSMLVGGWREGPVYSKEEKTHPELCSWAKLSKEAKFKFELFARLAKFVRFAEMRRR